MTEHAEGISRHCREISRCNQRGGRMLSIVDLIEAGTVTPELAAYFLAAIQHGASFMVGAMPSGAGKTTIMCALLNFVPAEVSLAAADGLESITPGIEAPMPRQCFICHEIGSGRYYAYLWGEELRQYFRLAEAGHMLATNLHADTYEQARDQICRANHVPESSLRRMNVMLFLSVSRGGRRRIEQVWESDGQQPHRLIYEAGKSRCFPMVKPSSDAARSSRSAPQPGVGSFHQDQAEVMLGVLVRADHVDGKAVLSGRCKDIDAAGLHGRSGLIGMPTAIIEGAGLTQTARALSKTEGFVETLKEQVPLEFYCDSLGLSRRRFEKQGQLVPIEQDPRLPRRGRMRRTNAA